MLATWRGAAGSFCCLNQWHSQQAAVADPALPTHSLNTLLLCGVHPAGIDSSNLASIFEEHVVLPHLDPFQPINCSFGLKDKVFNFGTLIAQLPELLGPEPGLGMSPRDPSGGAKKGGQPQASAKARASIAPGAGAADAAAAPAITPRTAAKADAAKQDTTSLLEDPAAVKANLKFINPKKVPCTVNFNILPQNGSQPGEPLCADSDTCCSCCITL